jgi:acetaldehyde dehydrogenase
MVAAAVRARPCRIVSKAKVAIVGSGNIGTDLMFKVLRTSSVLEVVALVGIDPASEGLARAGPLGVAAISDGLPGLLRDDRWADLAVVFDATSAAAHVANYALLAGSDVKVVDLTPAAIGPYVVPAVNLGEHLEAANVNMVTCGGQATIPIVAAMSSVTRTRYAEIVASIASRSAGPGTRANIDEFTETTARAIEKVGGAETGKAIIVLNPAEPPLIMRDTVLCLIEDCDPSAIDDAVRRMVADVQVYVPGYRLKQDLQFRRIATNSVEAGLLTGPLDRPGWMVSVFLEVEGAGHYLPPYAGNLDIMTSAALRVGERLAEGIGA